MSGNFRSRATSPSRKRMLSSTTRTRIVRVCCGVSFEVVVEDTMISPVVALWHHANRHHHTHTRKLRRRYALTSSWYRDARMGVHEGSACALLTVGYTRATAPAR